MAPLIPFLQIVSALDVSCIYHLQRVFNLDSSSSLYILEPTYEIEEFLKAANSSHFVFTTKLKQSRFEFQVDALVVTFASLNLVSAILQEVRRKVRMPPENTVIVNFLGCTSNLAKVFKMFWKHRLANVVVVAESKVFTYFPVTKGGCISAEPEYLGRCHQVTDFPKESEVTCFRNCTLQVSATIHNPFVGYGSFWNNSGFEVTLAELLLTHLKFDVNFTIGESHTEFYDVGFGGMELSEFIRIFDYAYYRSQEVTSFYLLQQPNKSPWMNILLIFDLTTWLLLLMSVVGIIVITLEAMYILSSLFESSYKAPKTFKPIFIIWTFTSFLLTSSYRCLLISVMFKSFPSTDYTSVEELVAAGYSFGGFFMYKYLFDSGDIATYYEDHFTDCSLDGSECFELLINRPKFAYATTSHVVYYYKNLNKGVGLRSLPDIKRSQITFHLSKGSPFRKMVQLCMTQLDEAGIIQILDVYEWVREEQTSNPHFRSVSMKHLYFIFGAYIVVTFLASIVFLIELTFKTITT